MTVRCLSVHAGYRCRHSGACCSGVFPIPVEPHVVALAPRACRGQISIFRETPGAGRGQISILRQTPGAGRGQISIFSGFEESRSDPRSAEVGLEKSRSDPRLETLPTGVDGACVFYERQSRLCTIHRLGGEGALPTVCRHFPRLFLRDDRGLTVSLSHYCPTAARLLLEDGPLEIVTATAPLALEGDVEAFEAAGALPPLLRPEVLTDLEGFDAWERAAIRVFGRDDLTPDECLALIGDATESIRTWKPGGAPLSARVEEGFGVAEARRPPRAGLHGGDAGMKRYLAAKLFGHRIAYECRGLRSMVEWLRHCLARLRDEAATVPFVEAVRAADLALVHQTDTAALARNLARIERRP